LEENWNLKRLWGLIYKFSSALVAWKCNLEQMEGFEWKFGGLIAFLEFFFSKTRGLNGIPVKGLGYRLIFEKLRGLNANWRGI
jgi:hypothetical protein